MIKAIETEYAGCRFRSRLEARWAVFFDALGVEWEHEPEGFQTSAGNYLPDFRVTNYDSWYRTLWFEVKPPSAPTDIRHDVFPKEVGYPLIVVRGLPMDYRSQYRAAPLVIHSPWGDPVEPVSLYSEKPGGFYGCHVRGPEKCARIDRAYRLARSERFGT